MQKALLLFLGVLALVAVVNSQNSRVDNAELSAGGELSAVDVPQQLTQKRWVRDKLKKAKQKAKRKVKKIKRKAKESFNKAKDKIKRKFKQKQCGLCIWVVHKVVAGAGCKVLSAMATAPCAGASVALPIVGSVGCVVAVNQICKQIVGQILKRSDRANAKAGKVCLKAKRCTREELKARKELKSGGKPKGGKRTRRRRPAVRITKKPSGAIRISFPRRRRSRRKRTTRRKRRTHKAKFIQAMRDMMTRKIRKAPIRKTHVRKSHVRKSHVRKSHVRKNQKRKNRKIRMKHVRKRQTHPRKRQVRKRHVRKTPNHKKGGKKNKKKGGKKNNKKGPFPGILGALPPHPAIRPFQPRPRGP